MHGQSELQMELPAAEIVVRIGGSDVCVLAFYLTGDTNGDVLIGITDTAIRADIEELLTEARLAIHAANWKSIRDMVDPDGPAAESEPPF